MRNASVQTIGVGVALLGLALLLRGWIIEGYQDTMVDPCARFKGCKECATQDGCGWCPGFGGRCSLMDKFGRPMSGLCHPSEYRLWPGQCSA
jgi:hypothetical protein